MTTDLAQEDRQRLAAWSVLLAVMWPVGLVLAPEHPVVLFVAIMLTVLYPVVVKHWWSTRRKGNR